MPAPAAGGPGPAIFSLQIAIPADAVTFSCKDPAFYAKPALFKSIAGKESENEKNDQETASRMTRFTGPGMKAATGWCSMASEN